MEVDWSSSMESNKEGCDATWEFDVNFDLACQNFDGHSGWHQAEIIGNGDVRARIHWETK